MADSNGGLPGALRRNVDGDVLFDAFSRGRYSTDASIYQIEPLGVVVPRTVDAAIAALEIAVEHDTAILPRGAGSSQCGQTVGAALVIDHSRHLNALLALDVDARTAWVEPGIVLDELNAQLRPHGLWFPVDVSTSAQATLGGMTANNSCGARSIRYGNMVHNVRRVEARLTSGDTVMLEPTAGVRSAARQPARNPGRVADLTKLVRDLYIRERDEIAARVPKLQRRVAGYNLDMAGAGAFNLAHLAVGSEGTLGFFTRVELQLAPLPQAKVLGVVHFPSFYDAMNLTQDIVKLAPSAVELVDRTMIDLARQIPAFRATIDQAIRGQPEAVLLVEFAGDSQHEQRAKLADLNELMADLRLAGSVVDLTEPAQQRDLWEVRKAGLNIMMSMKGDGKPISFIEDCAVPLEHLAEYTLRLTRVFERHGTRGTWYAHASVGCLHVRPVLDMRAQAGANKMRSIAEEACALVREYKGSYSGEHGDGLVRSEWIERMYGPRLTQAFKEIKQAFDPRGLMNPGKIVDPSPMDDRSLFRFPPDYETRALVTALDWSAHEVGEHNRGRGFAAALEMCNNNGHCRKFDAGAMCPSYRVTRNERDLTRGRANSLRLAMAGRLGPDALTSEQMHETMALCVSCKACKRECPTGVDMARIKIEFLHQYHSRHPRSLKDTLIASLPRYAPYLSRVGPLANLRDRLPGLARVSEGLTGFAARRPLPRWSTRPFRGQAEAGSGSGRNGELVLLADTFNRYFEPENLRSAVAVLTRAGYRTHVPQALDSSRPLCCGRTYLATGRVEAARAEATRLLAGLEPYVARGLAVVGLEPSCLLGLRDEIPSLCSGALADRVAERALLLEEFIAQESTAGRWQLELRALAAPQALVHGHCHQKAFGAMGSVVDALRAIPSLTVEPITSSCCGMAGAFGYDAEHFDISMQMAEAALLPAVRRAPPGALIVADGTSCRQQIRDGSGHEALHAVRVLDSASAA